MKRYVIALSIVVNTLIHIPLICFGFTVSVFPEDPKAGDGFLLTISDKGSESYEVAYNGKKYIPYDEGEVVKEIFLPVNINDRGIKIICVRKIASNKAGADIKTVNVDVRERKLQQITLSAQDEKMRDAQAVIPEQQKTILDSLKSNDGIKHWHKQFNLPLQNTVSTSFAAHRKGKTYSYYHRGLDFSAPLGTAVKAANRGKVILSRQGLSVYGNTIIVDHGQGIVSCYFHLSKLLKKEDDLVEKNEVIANVGNSGWATGPHLHFGIYIQGEPIDPLWWIRFTKQICTTGKR